MAGDVYAQAAARRTRRLELVHRIGRLDVSRRHRKHSRACGGAARRSSIDPCIPSSWPEYRITWRFQDSRYEITVSNPARRCRGVATATLDGVCVNGAAIPLVNDGGRTRYRLF